MSSEEKPTCLICRELLSVSGSKTSLPCGHTYCTSCIDEWLKKSRTCPTCRHTVLEESEYRIEPVFDRIEGKPDPTMRDIHGRDYEQGPLPTREIIEEIPRSSRTHRYTVLEESEYRIDPLPAREIIEEIPRSSRTHVGSLSIRQIGGVTTVEIDGIKYEGVGSASVTDGNVTIGNDVYSLPITSSAISPLVTEDSIISIPRSRSLRQDTPIDPSPIGREYRSCSEFIDGTFFSSENHFGSNCIFGIGCTFGSNCTFGGNCEFKSKCVFESGCIMNANSSFGAECIFRTKGKFGSNCEFGNSCEFGNDFYFGANCTIREKCRFGMNCKFGSNCDFYEECMFEAGTSFGANATFNSRCHFTKPTIFGANVDYGEGCSYLN